MRAEDRPEDRENKNKAKATAKNIEGKLQEALGHITGDPEDKIKGKAKQAEAADMHAKGKIGQGMPSQAPTSLTPEQPGYGTSDPYDTPQNVTPGQTTMPATPQPGYGTSHRDPNYPQGTTPLDQRLATGPAPEQPNPALGNDPYNNPQDVPRSQGSIENVVGKIQEAAGRLTGDPEDQAKGRAKQQNVPPPGQGPMSGPTPGQPGYDQRSR